MERKDQIFIGLLVAALIMFLLAQHSASARKGPTDRNDTVPETPDSETVGMSLGIDTNPPDATPFYGRVPLLLPPPMSLVPSTTIDAMQGVKNTVH